MPTELYLLKQNVIRALSNFLQVYWLGFTTDLMKHHCQRATKIYTGPLGSSSLDSKSGK